MRAVHFVMLVSLAGCGPSVRLEERLVPELGRAELSARSRQAYLRVRDRLDKVASGMSVPEVHGALAARVAIEQPAPEAEGAPLRLTLVDGLLCRVPVSPTRERWLFGYDEEQVILVGFALEFEREDPEDADWELRRVVEGPRDDCT